MNNKINLKLNFVYFKLEPKRNTNRKKNCLFKTRHLVAFCF